MAQAKKRNFNLWRSQHEQHRRHHSMIVSMQLSLSNWLHQSHWWHIHGCSVHQVIPKLLQINSCYNRRLKSATRTIINIVINELNPNGVQLLQLQSFGQFNSLIRR
jgi:hypothetical protein